MTKPNLNNEASFFGFMNREGIIFKDDTAMFYRTIKYGKALENPIPFCVNGSQSQYQRLIFSLDGKVKTCLAHRIVWRLFNGDIPESKQVDHINGIKNDNRITNLQLLSPSENIKKMHRQRKRG